MWQRRGSDFKLAYDKDDVWLQVVFKVSEWNFELFFFCLSIYPTSPATFLKCIDNLINIPWWYNFSYDFKKWQKAPDVTDSDSSTHHFNQKKKNSIAIK